MSTGSFLPATGTVLEYGPRLNFETAWGTTARREIDLPAITRIERSRRIALAQAIGPLARAVVDGALHDRMTEMPYPEPLAGFGEPGQPEATYELDVLDQGLTALAATNSQLGLGLDDHTLAAIMALFADELGRNPTNVELFAIGQIMSEHCRHPFFRGKLVLGGQTLVLVPEIPGQPSRLVWRDAEFHPTLTCETHNHPTWIASYPGAATCVGGCLRDSMGVGRGGLNQYGLFGLCTGNLHLPNLDLPWENDGVATPSGMASPLEIMIAGSRGAFDYGNCFGRPTIGGFARTFGMVMPDGTYRAWTKPIAFGGEGGLIDARHTQMRNPDPDMLIVQIGGPAYRIGVGGGSASSQMAGTSDAELDFASVQRGDPVTENQVYRVIAACVALGEANPIAAAHDLGAGGSATALVEMAELTGAHVFLQLLPTGDPTLSAMERFGCEAQERMAFLVHTSDLYMLQAICDREGVRLSVAGYVTDTGRFVLEDIDTGRPVVDLPLKTVYDAAFLPPVQLTTVPVQLQPLELPGDLTVAQALWRVLHTVAGGSTHWLTDRADRSVGGLVVRQQGVGPQLLPLADYGAVAHSFVDRTGTAVALGERPLVGLVDPAAQGRMTVAEAVLNLIGAGVIGLNAVKGSANWMWPAKLEGEGARMLAAAIAMTEFMTALGLAIDGGKDSLSMAAVGENGQLIKAPGQLTLTLNGLMPDIAHTVTPDLKQLGDTFFWVDLSGSRARLGGSLLAQTFQQIGDDCPDVEDPDLLARTFGVVQRLIRQGRIEALHDVSDGGLMATLVEMAIAGNRGLSVDLTSANETIAQLFAEEPGLVLASSQPEFVAAALYRASVPMAQIGVVGQTDGDVTVRHNGEEVFSAGVGELRRQWSEVSYHILTDIIDPAVATAEQAVAGAPARNPRWRLGYNPTPTASSLMTAADRPGVAIIREEGTNGHLEMAAAFTLAGFRAYDVTMSDLLEGRFVLDDRIRGIAFPGGFSYGDVLDAGKGWAGKIRFSALAAQFQAFHDRSDTFGFGVCNGAQLMVLLGWVGLPGLEDRELPRFTDNKSGNFKCSFPTVGIWSSPSIMLAGITGSAMCLWAHLLTFRGFRSEIIELC